MLNTPTTSEDRAPDEDKRSEPEKTDKRKDVKDDPSAEFIQELAESGSASELGTVNAAADAVEGKEDKAIRPKTKEKGEDDG